jgi:hypothetical protein
LYTTQEVTKGIKIKKKDSNNIITNSGVKSDKRFNLNSKDKSDFNNAINSDKDIKNKNI